MRLSPTLAYYLAVWGDSIRHIGIDGDTSGVALCGVQLGPQVSVAAEHPGCPSCEAAAKLL